MRRSIVILALFSATTLAGQNQLVTVSGVWQNGPEAIRLIYEGDAVAGKSATSISAPINPVTGKFVFRVDTKARPSILTVWSKRFIVMPGDSITLKIHGDWHEPAIEFAGSRGFEFGFLEAFQTAIGAFRGTLTKDASVQQYERAVQEHYQAGLTFTNQYFAGHEVRESYLAIVKDLITLRYYDDLLRPIAPGEVLKSELGSGYFQDIDPALLRRTDLLGIREFVMTVNYYNDYYYSTPSLRGRAYDSAAVADNIASALANFDGEMEVSLLLFIYAHLTQNGAQESASQIAWLNAHLDSVYAEDPDRLGLIQSRRKDFDIIGEPLPASILGLKVWDASGKIMTMGSVFRGDTVLYVDLWASWCAPCLAEMPNEKELITALAGKPVRFVLISSDSDDGAWQKAMSKIAVDAEHYRMRGGGDTHMQLAQYIGYNGIPRYLIIDKHGHLQSRDAPRPGMLMKNPSMVKELFKVTP